MYGVVLMMALSGGADVPAMNDVAAEPVARYGDHGHKEYRLFGGRHGCCGGGGCHGGYGGYGGYAGCYGGYGGCHGGYAGCYGGYGGCYGGGCYGSYGYGGGGGGYYGTMPYEGGYGYSSYGSPTYSGTSPYQGGYQYGGPTEGTEYYGESRTEAPATIVVRLPADAKLTVDGSATRSTDSLRTFVSPPLQPGKDYRYTLRAEVTRDGKKVERSRDVNVHAGRTSEVNFDFAERIPAPGQ